MNWSLKIFRVRGIDIKVHLTFLLIIGWGAWRWSQATEAGLQGALFGVVATLLLFASVTLHELGHSLVALYYQVRVQDITLMPLGGLARMEEIPEKPSQELTIAIAGPLVNFVIVAILIAIGVVLDARAIISLPELAASVGQVNWAGLLAYVTMANLALGLFNLIPAFPMDGGRVLRALMAVKLDYLDATVWAVKIGQGLAFLLGFAGFLTANFSMILIAVFVWMGAEGEGKQVQIKYTLGDLAVGQVMSRSPEALNESDTLDRAIYLTLNTLQSEFPVIRESDGSVQGMVCQKDILKTLKSTGETGMVHQALRSDFPVVRSTDLVFQAQKTMTNAGLDAVPVIDEMNRLEGLLTSRDINEAYQLISVNASLRALAA
jgi:stage IV sporulation protein FB